MKARAPGKVLLSGAYAVLEGAPALVASVNAYVVADAARAPDRITDEVACALRHRPLRPDGSAPLAPWFDASSLRTGGGAGAVDRKLGLGSSAAILVASLAALELAQNPRLSPTALQKIVFPEALRAHREAQGGGSGVDVAAATFGGISCCQIVGGTLSLRPWMPPTGLVFEVWASPSSASTRELLAGVLRWKRASPAPYFARIRNLSEWSEVAARTSSSEVLVHALEGVRAALEALGGDAGVPIVLPELLAWNVIAREEAGVVLPSGAGGGDLVLWVAPRPSPERLRSLARDGGYCRLSMTLGADGVACVEAERDERDAG